MDLLEKTKKPIYLFLIFVIYLSYFLTFFGIYYVDPDLLKYFTLGVNLFVCLFLLIRFHPFQTHELRYFDDKLIFASGIILLSNLGIDIYLKPLHDTTKMFYESILK
jgi:hypothetical protein